MKYNGLFLVPKSGENKPMEQEAQAKKAVPARAEEYRECFREGFKAGRQKRLEYSPPVKVLRVVHKMSDGAAGLSRSPE